MDFVTKLFSVEYTTDNNFTIQYASENGHIEIVKYLVLLGADYSHTIQWTNTKGHTEIVKYLKLLNTK